MMDKKSNLIWVDLEMTGLNPDTDRIIEIATVVTDKDLNVLAQGPNLVVHQSDEALDAMDEWCTTHHGESGLTQRVKDSTLSDADAEAETLMFLKEWVEPGASPLCGNSIWQDRRFLVRYMPFLDAFCHYRNIDVSTLKELARRWHPEVLKGFQKQGSHRALDDILESIGELKHYREHFIRLG
jgi:oligoribonuclease